MANKNYPRFVVRENALGRTECAILHMEPNGYDRRCPVLFEREIPSALRSLSIDQLRRHFIEVGELKP